MRSFSYEEKKFKVVLINKVAVKASLVHLAISILVASLAAILIFKLWFPEPFSELSGGNELFKLLVSVDVILGPLLTLFVFKNTKSRRELIGDLSIIGFLQIAALGYGVWTLQVARPVLLGFEGDRIRLVHQVDILESEFKEYPVATKYLLPFDINLVGVKLLNGADQGYLDSLKMAFSGVHPAYRPSRWQPVFNYKELLLEVAKPLAVLATQDRPFVVQGFLNKVDKDIETLVYLPLAVKSHENWVIVLEQDSLDVVGYIKADGW